MKSKKTTYTLMIILSLVLLFQLSFNFTNVNAGSDYKGKSKPIVIFDVAHQQTFNHTQMQSAIQAIEEHYEITVFINYDNFSLVNLQGADLIILPAPYLHAIRALESDNSFSDSAFSEIERRALFEFYRDGGSVLYLANPYFFEEEMRNYTSNSNYLNYMMGSGGQDEVDYGSLSIDQAHITLMNDLNNRYDDERFIYIDNKTISNDHSIIQGFLNSSPVDELLTYTTSISTIFAQRLINTSVTTYEVNADGEVQGGKTQEHTVLAANEIDAYDSRGISCASAIMFSDLAITNTSSDTWFEVYDNALLWENMISWLLFKIPEVEDIKPIPPIGIFAASIIAIFFVFMVFGSVLFTVGREVRKVEVSETIIKMREQEKLRKKVDKEIEEAYYAEDDAEDELEEEEEEKKEIDMKSISDEIKKKPPKTRSRSERRRGN
ncbi:MAG: hypothetical protein JJE41_06695 [Candidatus Heimdallarchaeota archaeon]|nr:hypothetical protein [Candidatus Heimdallarchaeota archaeon]